MRRSGVEMWLDALDHAAVVDENPIRDARADCEEAHQDSPDDTPFGARAAMKLDERDARPQRGDGGSDDQYERVHDYISACPIRRCSAHARSRPRVCRRAATKGSIE